MKDKRVIFMGTPEFAVPVLDALIENTNVVLVVSQKDAPVGRKKILTPSPVKEEALKKGIEVFTPDKIKLDHQKILDLNPDLIITCAYGQILPVDILNAPKIASINVHASLLPKLRGGAPIQRSIMDGLDKTGVTIMYMDKGMDTGNIIKERELDILDSDTYGTLSNKLSILGKDLLIETLPSIIDGTNDSIKQDENEVTFGYNITKEDELIDFNTTTREVFNKIRGLNPNPGAYFKIDDEVIKVYESRIGDKKGQVSRINSIYKDGIGIGTNDGEIIITKIKPAGKKLMDVKSYLNGVKIELKGKKVNEKC